MDKELQTPRISKLATTGVGHFGEAGEEGGQDPLFRVVAGHSVDHAVEQATVLMCAVHKISDLAMADHGGAGRRSGGAQVCARQQLCHA